MTVSRAWPKTIRNTSGQLEINLDANLCSTSVHLLPTNGFASSSPGSGGQPYPLYPLVVGHTLPSIEQSYIEILSLDQVIGNIQLQPQIVGSGPAKLFTDHIPPPPHVEPQLSASETTTTSTTDRNEKSVQAATVRRGMANDSLDQKYFVFSTTTQQTMSTPPPPPLPPPVQSTNALSLPHHHNNPHGGGSLNVLSLSAVHHHMHQHSVHQNSLSSACAPSVAPALPPPPPSLPHHTMDALHSNKDAKVSLLPHRPPLVRFAKATHIRELTD